MGLVKHTPWLMPLVLFGVVMSVPLLREPAQVQIGSGSENSSANSSKRQPKNEAPAGAALGRKDDQPKGAKGGEQPAKDPKTDNTDSVKWTDAWIAILTAALAFLAAGQFFAAGLQAKWTRKAAYKDHNGMDNECPASRWRTNKGAIWIEPRKPKLQRVKLAETLPPSARANISGAPAWRALLHRNLLWGPLAVQPQITYTLGPSGGPMAKAKSTVEDGKTQHQRFVEAAREMGAGEDAEAFRRIVHKVATAPTKKAAKKRKR